VREKDIGRILLTTAVPGEIDAQRRAWNVVRAAYAEREPVPRRAKPLRPLIALAVMVAVVAAAVSPVGGWVRDRVQGEEHAQPALFRIPTAGQLLVVSERGPWIVRQDGSKRLLGDYEGASFSPRGLFVVVTSGRRITAVEPGGDPRWSVTRPQTVAQARWAPSGFRVAYRAGDTLRVVDGDGTDDRLLARGVAAVAPAWRPGAEHVLAYADARGTLNIVNADTGAGVLRTHAVESSRALVWSPDGRLLLAVTNGSIHPIFDRRGELVRTIELPPGHVMSAAAFAPSGRAVAYADVDPATGRGALAVYEQGSSRTLQRGEGRFADVAWSPNGRWLLVTWPDADQFLFLRLPGVRKIVAVSGIRREFDPGAESPAGAFPHVAGWLSAPQ
jgi:WD40 repeat protein